MLGTTDLKATPRFLDDARRLAAPEARKLASTIRLLREHGVTYGSLKTRPIERNPDLRFRLMNVDDGYRIVAAVEGANVFLLKVGNHDEAERWGERATLREYEERLALDPSMLAREKRIRERPTTDTMFELQASLAEIAASDEVADLLADCVDGVLEGWIDGTIEDWMVFLSAVQRRAVDRAVGGPSRVTGGPGTGKSVVGLHRAVGFARELHPGEKLLMTSFVNTVPDVLAGLFERLASDLADRLEFRSVHGLAIKTLGGRGPEVDERAAERRFLTRLRTDRDRYRQLTVGARLSEDYLWDEVTRVIEGRGLVDRSQYLGLQRHGRKRPLPAMVRGLLWDVYEEYREACDFGRRADRRLEPRAPASSRRSARNRSEGEVRSDHR